MDKSYLNLGILFAGIGMVFGTILIVREIDKQNNMLEKPIICSSVLIERVGGCNSDGLCGILFSGIDGISKGKAKYPVAGESVCREKLFK